MLKRSRMITFRLYIPSQEEIIYIDLQVRMHSRHFYPSSLRSQLFWLGNPIVIVASREILNWSILAKFWPLLIGQIIRANRVIKTGAENIGKRIYHNKRWELKNCGFRQNTVKPPKISFHKVSNKQRF